MKASSARRTIREVIAEANAELALLPAHVKETMRRNRELRVAADATGAVS